MSYSQFRFEALRALLRKRADDPLVVNLIGRDHSQITRDAYLGFVELRDVGISVMFAEAAWVVPPTEYDDPATLYLSGYHLHRASHEGYAEYSGELPGLVMFGDDESNIVR